MTHYRIYLFGLGGYYLDTVEFDGVNDAHALTRMAGYAGQAPALELWDGRRLVYRSCATD